MQKLLAPNGNPSNLTPEQYSVVRTPEFKAWFGDWENDPENSSKVVDENGEPLVVYHGTDNEFTTFKLGYGSYSSFTENKRLALSYGHIVNSFFLSIKNPYIINGGGQYIWNVIGESQDPESFFGGNVPFSNDGIIFKDVIDFNGTLGSKYVLDVSNVIMVRKNTQIKLADGTNTTFDGNNPDIRFDNGGEVQPKDLTKINNFKNIQKGVDYYSYSDNLEKQKKADVWYELFMKNQKEQIITPEEYKKFISLSSELAWEDLDYDGSNTTFDTNNPDIRFENGGEVEDLISKGIVELKMFDTKPEHAKEYGLDSINPLYVQTLSVTKNKRLQGIGNKVLQYIDDYAIKNGHDVVFGHITQKAEPNIDILKSMLIKSGFNTCEGNNDFYKKIDIRYKEGGRTIAQTPAPKKDQIKGSDKNKAGSSKDIKSAKSIKFSDSVVEKLINKIDEHNEKYPNKKIDLATAKSVVRRGMGAYSSSHRPTISGGRPNSRVAWGIARLNAFIYKIINGKSKSGKYNQDDDLINELGYKVKNYAGGGELISETKSKLIEILSNNKRYEKAKIFEKEGAEILKKVSYSNSQFANSIQKLEENFILIATNYDTQTWGYLESAEYLYFPKPNENTEIKVEYKYDLKEYPIPVMFDKSVIENSEYTLLRDYEEINSSEFDENYLYRGMSFDEMSFIIENNAVKSNASMNIGTQQENTTSFAQDIGQASNYAVGFNAWYDEISFQKPRYVIKVQKAGVDFKPTIETDPKNEVDVYGDVSSDKITDVYEIRLGVCDGGGNIQIKIDMDENPSEGSRSPMFKNVYVRKLSFSELRKEFSTYQSYKNGGEIDEVDSLFFEVKEKLESDGYEILMGSDSKTDFGHSRYMYVNYHNKSDDNFGSGLKIRVSDHSVENKYRMFDEIHFRTNDKDGYMNNRSFFKIDLFFKPELFKKESKKEFYNEELVVGGNEYNPETDLIIDDLGISKRGKQKYLVERKKYKQIDNYIDSRNNKEYRFDGGGQLKTQYQKRNVGGSDVYYKRENNGKWLFISKEEFDLNTNNNNTILFNSNSEMDLKDTIKMDVPLFIRMLEMAREDIKSDEQLHQVVENVLDLKDKTQTMDDYEYLSEPLTENYALGGVLNRPNARMYYVIWNDYIGSMELGTYDIELIGNGHISIVQGAFQSMSDAYTEFFDYIKSEDGLYFSRKQPKSKWSIESRFYDGVSQDSDGYPIVKEKVLFKMSAKELIEMYDANVLKRGGQTVTSSNNRHEEGGVIEGQLHSECNDDDGCGEKFEVGKGGHMIEAERDEAVIVSKAFDDNKKYTIEGEPSEIASALNVLGGGKNFDSGATIFTDKGEKIKTEEIKTEAKDKDVERTLESGSIIINRRSMADKKDYKVTGTPRQIASAINSINGNGVVIEDGAIIK